MDSLASPRTALRQARRKRQKSSTPLARLFAGLQFIEGHCADVTVSSSGHRRGFIVSIQTYGSAIISHGDDRTSVASEEAFVIARPSRVVWHPADSSSRCIIVSGGPAFSLRFHPGPRTAVRLDALYPITLLLKDCLEQLKAFVPTADATITQKLGEVLADLVDAAIEDANRSSSTRHFLAKLARAESYVDDPEFAPQALANKCGFTLRALQKRFRPLNTTPRRWILERRLERIRKNLDDPLFRDLTMQKIAARGGLSDLSHFIHVFKEAFGVPPGQYRLWRGERKPRS